MQNNIQKNIKSRVILKHDIEANWNRAEDSFRPLNGEIIIYDPDADHPYIRYKRGKTDPNNSNQTLLLKDLEFETNMYIGADEPQNPPVGFLWLDNSITFNVMHPDGYLVGPYIAEEGMTLREWVNSKYKVPGWSCSSSDEGQIDHEYGIVYDSSYDLSEFNENQEWIGIVDCDNVIIPNHIYTGARIG